MSWHPLRRFAQHRRLLRPVLAGAAIAALAGTVVLVGARGGYPVDKVRLLSGSAWLPSMSVGQLTLLDGSSAEVAAQVQVAGRGDRLDAVQQGANAYAVNRTAGTIRRVDGATFEMSAPATLIPDARDGLQALAAPDALYALDARRGVLTTADPVTLAGRGGSVPLATEITPQAATLDAEGRLWVLDAATGDLIWIENGRRHTRRAASQPGSGLLALADGAPVVIDTASRTAAAIDPASGDSRGSVQLDLRPDDRIQVSGSAHSSRLYVVAARGILTVCDLTATTCGSAVPLGADGGDLGTPVETGGHLFVPDYTTGKVWIVDLQRSTVVGRPQVLNPKTHFQLLTRDGVVFFNDPASEHAGVIHLDGGVQPIAKYDPKDPAKGLTTSGQNTPAPAPTSAPPTVTPARPTQTPSGQTSTPPVTPPRRGDTRPPQPPDRTTPPASGTLQISVSKTSVRVGEELTLKVVTSTGRPPGNPQWTYGDGQTGTGTLVTHQWSKAQMYQVSVRATMSNGQQASASVSVSVSTRPTLTVRVTGNGTVTGVGISCPAACVATPDFGQSTTLTARPAPGAKFAGWGGACTGRAETCTLVANASQNVTADFRAGNLPAPVQTSPADGQLFTHFPRTTTLKWQAVDGATSYHVEIQCDTCGSSPWTPWEDVTVTSTSHSFTWVGDNVGRWRVTAIGPNGPGTSSGFRTFRFRTAPATLPAPVLTSPADGQLFTNFPRTTTLRWRAVTGAARYNVEIQCDTCGSTPWTPWENVTVTSTSHSFTWVGDNVGRWRVTAIDSAGTRGDTSGFRTFRFRTAPATLPAPALISPADGQVFSVFPRTTTLRWQSVAGGSQYNVEVQYNTGSSWVTLKNVTVTQTSLTFDFVGAQPGRWRVTAVSAGGARGTPSGFRTFRYTI